LTGAELVEMEGTILAEGDESDAESGDEKMDEV
jgi:hypothetical protein